jgi:hypothetical protein
MNQSVTRSASRSFATAAFAAAALALLSPAACTPPVPATPTYTNDVQPILAAHCVRCHGAGGTLNAIPGIPTTLPAPAICYLQQYDNDPPDCPVAATCKHGAAYCAPMFETYIDFPNDTPNRMPPNPSDLSDWEKDVLRRWGRTSPPAP